MAKTKKKGKKLDTSSKGIKAAIKKINALKLLDYKIKPGDDEETLVDDFCSAIEDIDDDGKLKKVPTEIVDLYNVLVPEEEEEDDDDGDEEPDDVDDDDGDEDEEEPDEEEPDEEEPDEEDVDVDELLEELEPLKKVKDLKDFIEENDLDVSVKKGAKAAGIKKAIKAALEELREPEEEEEEKEEEAGDSDVDLEEVLEEVDDAEDVDELKDIIEEHDLDVKVTKKSKLKGLSKKVKAALEEKYGSSDDGDEEEPDEEEEEPEKPKKGKGKKKDKGKPKKGKGKKKSGNGGPSNVEFMKEMMEAGKKDKEILKAFQKRYAEKGVDDVDFIKKRISIYKKLVEKEG